MPSVDGVIDLIRCEFQQDPHQLSALDEALATARDKRYQAAFQFLQGRRGQQTANEIIRKAVLAARTCYTEPNSGITSVVDEADAMYRRLDLDARGWFLTPGVESLGKLLVQYPDRFGRSILTTNFDPLIEAAIQTAGGQFFRTILHSDGNLSQTDGMGCHVIHLHGYWYGSDTLHTARQLGQPRPRLKASLSSLLRNKLVVVCAYGAWDDAFTEALMEVVRDDSAYPEVIWTCHSQRPLFNESLSLRLEPGIDRGRVNLYAGIDCHQLFPKLLETWSKLEPSAPTRHATQSNTVRVPNALISQVLTRTTAEQPLLEGDDEDRPPVIDLCLGRESELLQLRNSISPVVFLTGLGGEGKSTLAARYFSDSQSDSAYSVYIWRDCKEESERFENQLASVIEKLSGGAVSGKDLPSRTPSQSSRSC